MKKILVCIIVIVTAFFISKSIQTMITVPFHDFDEAHRAESSRNMILYKSYLVPLNGSPFELGNYKIYIPRRHPYATLYYHLERQPFVYWSMMLSTQIFGQDEFAYRLPSFIFGLATFIVVLFFILRSGKTTKVLPLIVAIVVFLTSYDWWLSSQNALLDTGVSLFLFLALGLIIFALRKNSSLLAFLSGVTLFIAFLCKGSIILFFIFPFLVLIVLRKFSIRLLLIFSSTFILFFVTFFLLLTTQFKWLEIIKVYLNFVKNRATLEDNTQRAPIFWYARWWWDSFRPGWTLFLAAVSVDILKRRLSWLKLSLLAFIFGGLALMSISVNKVWWYVLPLLPAISWYVYFFLRDEINKTTAFLSLILIIASLPILLTASNTVTLIYGIIVTSISIILICEKNRLRSFPFQNAFLVLAIFLSLFFLVIRFPTIHPTYPENKEIGAIFHLQPEPKCLFVWDMPYEAALYYSKARDINYYVKGMKLDQYCTDYLLSPDKLNFPLVSHILRLNLYKLDMIK